MSKYLTQNICEMGTVRDQILIFRRLNRKWDAAVFEAHLHQAVELREKLRNLYKLLEEEN